MSSNLSIFVPPPTTRGNHFSCSCIEQCCSIGNCLQQWFSASVPWYFQSAQTDLPAICFYKGLTDHITSTNFITLTNAWWHVMWDFSVLAPLIHFLMLSSSRFWMNSHMATLHRNVWVTAVHTEDGVKSERDGDKTRQIKGLTEGTERKKKGGGRVGGGGGGGPRHSWKFIHSFHCLLIETSQPCPLWWKACYQPAAAFCEQKKKRDGWWEGETAENKRAESARLWGKTKAQCAQRSPEISLCSVRLSWCIL